MKQLIAVALQGYKRWISPALANGCRFTPTCSEYALEAVHHHGIIAGGLMSVWRLLRCNPFSRCGFDPVPRARAHPRFSWPR